MHPVAGHTRKVHDEAGPPKPLRDKFLPAFPEPPRKLPIIQKCTDLVGKRLRILERSKHTGAFPKQAFKATRSLKTHHRKARVHRFHDNRRKRVFSRCKCHEIRPRIEYVRVVLATYKMNALFVAIGSDPAPDGRFER